MKKGRLLYSFIAFCIFQLTSCQKEEVPDNGNVPELERFNVESQIGSTHIDNVEHTISFEIGELFDWRNLKLSYTLSGAGSLSVDGHALTSTLDLSKPTNLTVSSPDGQNHITWQLNPTSLLSDYGLGRWLERGKSNEKDHPYYFDQGDSGPHQYINCGPAVTTMALKWADPSFSSTVEDARRQILPEGGWWYTSNIQAHLQNHGLRVQYYRLSEEMSLEAYTQGIAEIIDAAKIGILCLDMYYVARESDPGLRINKFYDTQAPDWGHFILVKGYKIVDGTFWLETMDPYSFGDTYADDQLKGDHRYYSAAELKKATDIWWPYIMAVSHVSDQSAIRTKLRHVQPSAVVHRHGGRH